jgi:hypothetical protein
MDPNTTLLQLEEKRTKLYAELYTPKITEDRHNTDYAIMRKIVELDEEIAKGGMCMCVIEK